MARMFTRANGDNCYQGINTAVTSATQTICGWFYETARNAGSPGNTLWSMNGAGGFNEINSNNGALYIAYQDFGWINVSATLPANAWAHVATRASGSNYQFFFNGSPGYQHAASIATAVFPLIIGGWATNSAVGGPTQAYFAGRIADVAVWNVALTDSELAALAQGARPRIIRPASLVSYFPLDGLASPEPDLSGKHRNGTLAGTAYANGPPVTMFTPRWPRNYDAVAATVPLSQTHFRFRTDTNAVDATPTWGDAEDAA